MARMVFGSLGIRFVRICPSGIVKPLTMRMPALSSFGHANDFSLNSRPLNLTELVKTTECQKGTSSNLSPPCPVPGDPFLKQ